MLYSSKPMYVTFRVSSLKLLITKENCPALSVDFPTPDLAKYTEAKLTGSLVWASVTVPDIESCCPEAAEAKNKKKKNDMLCLDILKNIFLY